MVDSMNFLPDAQHDLLMDFTSHERIRHFIASAPLSDNGVQPVESAAFGEQLSAEVQASLAVAVAQCMREPLT
ncbi:hypothetical protein RB195_017233 [Necator americanus]|uniref:Uncharacterized protein n=1 Tax=Necator americanus TaxID=51031 RepID=A0ABR1C6C1_NECAM